MVHYRIYAIYQIIFAKFSLSFFRAEIEIRTRKKMESYDIPMTGRGR